MNTGLHDVWNLVWKLELAVRGSGSEALLESYSEERVPMIEEVIETTDRLTKALGTPSTLAQLLRDWRSQSSRGSQPSGTRSWSGFRDSA